MILAYIHHQLVSTRDHPQIVVLQEGVRHVRAKDVTCRSRRRVEAHSSFIRVGPKKIAHRTGMGNIYEPVDGPDVIYFLDLGAQTSVDAENHVVHESCQRQEVKDFSEKSPHSVVTVLLYTLIVEPVKSVGVRSLVVASQDSDSVFVADLQSDDQGKTFDTVVASVHVVAEKQEIGVLGQRHLLEAHHRS